MRNMLFISCCIKVAHAVSCDFIAPVKRYNANQFTYVENAEALIEQHHLALSNCLAQSRLLAFGNQV